MDNTLLARKAEYARGDKTAAPIRLGAGAHRLAVRFEDSRGSSLKLRVEVPGPVVDSVSPSAAPAGTQLTFSGEGFYGPLTVTSTSTPLLNAHALLDTLATAEVTPGVGAGPLKLTTAYGSAFSPNYTTTERPFISAEQVQSIPLTPLLGTPLLVIPEARYRELSRTGLVAPEKAKQDAAYLAALTSRPETLGALGLPQEGFVSESLFLVARDWRLGPTGEVESRDLFVAAAHLTGFTEYATSPRLAINAQAGSALRCQAAGRGCRPASGNVTPMRWASSAAAGLPTGIILNLESGPPAPNASGVAPTLVFLESTGGELVQNEFQCRDHVFETECRDACSGPVFGTHETCQTQPKNLFAAATDAFPLEAPSGVVVLRESDFKRLAGVAPGTANIDALSLAARFAALGNQQGAIGLTSRLATNVDVSAGLVAVVRDGTPANDVDRGFTLEATEWYLATVPVAGFVEVAGFSPELLFTRPPDTNPQPQCGVVTVDQALPSCGDACLPPSVMLDATSRFGVERWAQSLSRVSLRIPGQGVNFACRSFPQAPPSNFTQTAWQSQPLPAGVAMIPRTAWDAALSAARESGKSLEVSASQRAQAMSLASMANDVWTAGVASAPLGEGRTFGPGQLLIVANDAQLTADRRVIATDYFVVAANVSGQAAWVATGLEFGIAPNAFAGGGRCCGPESTGQQTSPPRTQTPAPGCSPDPKALCDTGSFINSYDGNSQGDARVANGLPAINFVTFSGNTSVTVSMNAPLGGVGSYRCAEVKPSCDVEQPGTSPLASWEADIPRGNTCAPGSPVSGRVVPAACTFASSSVSYEGAGVTVIRAPGGGTSPSTCEGRCPECTSLSAINNTGFVPRQCWLQSAPDRDDLCGNDSQQLVSAIQGDISARTQGGAPCGDLNDPSAICACHSFEGARSGFELCDRCSGSGHDTNCITFPARNGVATHVTGNECGGATGISCFPVEGSFGNGGLSTTQPVTIELSPLPCTVGCGTTARHSSAPKMSARAEEGPVVANAQDQDGTSAKAQTKKDPETAGDPVTLFNGALLLEQTDLSFPGPRQPLTFSREYTSASSYRGALGSNWSHNWETRLIPLRKQNLPSWVDPYCAGTPLQTTCVMLVQGAQSRVFYLDQSTGLYLPQAGSFTTIRREANGWAARQPEGSTSTFDLSGALIRERDRFGNGFTLEYESTAAGLVYDTLCPALAYVLRDGGYEPQVGPTGLSADTAQCLLLSGLTGLGEMPTWSGAPMASLPFPLPANASTVVQSALSAVLASQSLGYGTPQPYGPRYRRLTRVTDDLGRTLTFSYNASGLLAAVDGPLNTRVEFSYGSPTQPEARGSNEAFLLTARRKDAATGVADVKATPARGHDYQYAWQGEANQLPADLPQVAAAYKAYFDAMYNCGYATHDACGGLNTSGVMFANTDKLVAAQVLRRWSDAADNILTVTAVNDGASESRVEAETRYFANAYDTSFDRVFAQRWGADSSAPPVAMPALPRQVSWLTNLPLAVFEYSSSTPRVGTGGTIIGNETESFLPAELASRFPLEPIDTDAAFASYRKGLLLQPNASTGLPDSIALPPLAVGETQWIGAEPARQACHFDKLPQLRTRLPGYQPSVDYFDTTLPSVALATPGVSFTQRLTRAQVSCETLALAETYDARHNDLLSTWKLANDGFYVFQTMTGRRAHLAANANRICEWVRYTDRDGAQHLTGLGFHGRPLVEAVLVKGIGGADSWKVAETLYNADANVVAQRRTTSSPWTAADGDTRYRYQEEQVDSGKVSAAPRHWALRGNVIRLESNPRGAAEDQDEASGALKASSPRYIAISYEPFFNQVRSVERGTVESGLDVRVSRSGSVFDYQEFRADESALAGLLDDAQSWGAGFPVNGGYELTALPVRFYGVELNGDGQRTGLALPVRMIEEGLSGAREESVASWSVSGSLMALLEPNGVRTDFTYFRHADGPNGQRHGASLTAAPGNAGFLASMKRTRLRWDGAGPTAGCPQLPPEFKYLAPDCDTAALKLPSEVEAQLEASMAGFETTFDYNSLGSVAATIGFSGEREAFITDTDGRELARSLFNSEGQLHSALTIRRDAFSRPSEVKAFDALGVQVGYSKRTFDNEDRLTSECQASKAGECDTLEGSTTRYEYAREGALFRVIDPEGLVSESQRDERQWVTRTILRSRFASEGERVAEQRFDDDGNVVSRTRGVATQLTEQMRYDGWGRLIGFTEESGTEWVMRYSRRDQLLARELRSGKWSERFTWDDMGRAATATRNGILTTRLFRTAGGEVFARTGDGKGVTYVSTDALGRAVWTMDAAGNQVFATESHGAGPHTRSQVHLRQRGPMTSSVLTLDALGLPVSAVELGQGNLRRQTRLQRDAHGNALRVTTPDNVTTEADYDWLSRQTALRQPKQFGTATGFESSAFTYNRRGQLLETKDPKDEVTVQLYDGFGALQSKTLPMSTPQVSRWEYDELGRRTRYTVGADVNLGYRYDAQGRLVAVVRGAPESMASPELQTMPRHDELGRVLEATRFNLDVSGQATVADRAVRTTRTYDDAARIYSETTAVGRTTPRKVQTSWALAAGKWQRTTLLPDSRTTRKTFDGDGRLEELQRATGPATAFSWADDLLTDETSATATTNSLSRRIGYDAFAMPSAITFTTGSTPSLALSFRRDSMGRVAETSATFTVSSGSRTSWRGYTYDALGRLSVVREAGAMPSQPVPDNLSTEAAGAAVEASANAIGAARWAYTREAVGSLSRIARTDVPAVIGTPPPTRFGAAPRASGYLLTAYAVDTTLRTTAHDAAGRLSNDGTQGFEFGDMGELSRTTNSQGSTKELFLYDFQGRLVAQLDAALAGEVYVHDGAQMVQAYATSTGAQQWNATWGPGLDALVSVDRVGQEYFALDDGKGSVIGWQSAAGAVLSTAEYTPEGRGKYVDEVTGVVCEEAGATRCRGGSLGMPFGFHTALQSRESGLLYFRNRWYSPETAQWLSEDPLGTVDSFDLYAFNAFDSVNNVDPMGLSVGEATGDGRGCKPGEKFCTEVREERKLQGGDLPNRMGMQTATTPASPACKGAICESMGSVPDSFASREERSSSTGGSPGYQSVSGILARTVAGAAPASRKKRTLIVYGDPREVSQARNQRDEVVKWMLTAKNRGSYEKILKEVFSPLSGKDAEVDVRPLTTTAEAERLLKEYKTKPIDTLIVIGHQFGGVAFFGGDDYLIGPETIANIAKASGTEPELVCLAGCKSQNPVDAKRTDPPAFKDNLQPLLPNSKIEGVVGELRFGLVVDDQQQVRFMRLYEKSKPNIALQPGTLLEGEGP